jgi:hypothetical protein
MVAKIETRTKRHSIDVHAPKPENFIKDYLEELILNAKKRQEATNLRQAPAQTPEMRVISHLTTQASFRQTQNSTQLTNPDRLFLTRGLQFNFEDARQRKHAKANVIKQYAADHGFGRPLTNMSPKTNDSNV